jgi:hypothetical protein
MPCHSNSIAPGGGASKDIPSTVDPSRRLEHSGQQLSFLLLALTSLAGNGLIRAIQKIQEVMPNEIPQSEYAGAHDRGCPRRFLSMSGSYDRQARSDFGFVVIMFMIVGFAINTALWAIFGRLGAIVDALEKLQ